MCIFFMLSVHVNPALDWAAVGGLWGTLGVVWTDVLGRASVAALSLISGYLLVGSLSRKAPLKFVADRFRSICVPMVLWNAVFILGVMLAAVLFGVRTSSLLQIADAGPMELVLERLLFVYGAPAVQALAFLRDLAVASVILFVALRLLGRHLIFCLPILLAISLLGSLEPIVYRPNILLFMTAGVVLRQHAVSLAVPKTWRVPLLATFCVAVAVRIGVATGSIELTETFARAENLALRVVLTLVFLDISGALVRSAAAEWLLNWERHVFLAYLSHTSVISALWLLWKMGVGEAELPAYGAFFLLAPIAAFAAARIAAPVIATLPRAAQIAIRGKAVRAAAPAIGLIHDRAAPGPL
jgi:hypothetical protein